MLSCLPAQYHWRSLERQTVLHCREPGYGCVSGEGLVIGDVVMQNGALDYDCVLVNDCGAGYENYDVGSVSVNVLQINSKRIVAKNKTQQKHDISLSYRCT